MIKKRVLIVDDEPAIHSLIVDIVQELGCETLIAENAEKALVILKNSAPDLVLLDVGLPGMNGWDLCKIMKQDRMTKFIPVVMLTAHTVSLSTLSYASKADSYLGKPFTRQQLKAVIEKYIYKF